jgi:hypothetical protein
VPSARSCVMRSSDSREAACMTFAIPLVNPKDVVFVSKRVGNYQRHPVLGTLISQLWVR